MERSYADAYRDLYQKHWWWRAREVLILRLLRELCAAQPVGTPPRILDVGCGDGLFFPRLAELGEVSGVEADAQIVTVQGPLRERIHIGPFDESFAPGGSFDLILMLDVLEHLPDPGRALAHARRLLAPQGRLVVTVPAFLALWTRHDEWNQHRTRYTKRTLRAEAEEAGLDIEDGFYFFHWTAPAKLLVRLKERFGLQSDQAPHLPSALANALAFRLTRWEQVLLGRLRLPFGSSLLAVMSRSAERPATAN
jgi:SAM-dependent methyltransferase